MECTNDMVRFSDGEETAVGSVASGSLYLNQVYGYICVSVCG